ncbi:hypothetical protein AGDE_09280 [Angomonas deanei]|uniref:Mitochondrial glycoprotein, putative n=1 Tax=Angomonas deanei TaxID=59799 RepID=A0A7G2CJR1_9TRYP|nr:hypothetical protein AGDE_09280 [Angomonas deanei]CAD2219629.1 Mitochondrial glycoprotein, putative [Angomonas deanei]|eukprot:EPY30759.1 hypothetical protein AGDE_09280 [Angomonas deanei]
MMMMIQWNRKLTTYVATCCGAHCSAKRFIADHHRTGNEFYDEEVTLIGKKLTAMDEQMAAGTQDSDVLENTTAAPSQKRKKMGLHESLVALRRKVSAELTAEVERDTVEGVMAIPPLAPRGWHVHHTSGSNYFTMQQTIRRQKAQERKEIGKEDSRWVLQKGGKYQPSEETPKPTAVRSDTSVSIFAPFRVQDLSMADYNVPLVEWSVFDVMVRKTNPTKRKSPTIPTGQEKVWDTNLTLFLQLASVNSELRIRRAFFLTDDAARKLEEQTNFGAGDPIYRELLSRVVGAAVSSQADAFQRKQLQRRTDGEKGSDERKVSAASTDAPLLRQFGLNGDYARTLLYNGPYVSELSNELKDAFLSYIMNELGISSEVVEYICQTQYHMEQEEYMGWLGSWDSFATELLRHTPV